MEGEALYLPVFDGMAHVPSWSIGARCAWGGGYTR